MTEVELYQQYLNETKRAPAQASPSDAELYAQYMAETKGTAPELPEAELGFLTRAQYALEPIESNREALLAREFGKENILKKNGELYVRQNGYERPVNESGFSMADAAEFAGALPEVIPTAIGSVLGGGASAIVGAPTGPGAIGTGMVGASTGRAIGGGLGSLFRQALSASTGTPQVATAGERAKEAAFSAGSSVIGGKIVDVAAPYVKKLPGLGRLFSSSADRVEQSAKQNIPQALEQSVDVELRPIVPDEIEDVVTPRELVDQEMAKLTGIAEKYNLPAPTYAQAAGGKAIIAEGKLKDTPLIGAKAREYGDKQIKAVRKELEKIAGPFLDAESTAFETGLATKELAQANEYAQKEIASKLYQQIDELGAKASVGKRTFFNKYRDFAGEYGLINPDLSRAVYAADSGLTPNEFKTLQDALFDGMGAIQRTKSPKVDFKSVDALRRTAKAIAEENEGTNTARILNKFVDQLEDTSQRVLNKESPRLGEVFTEARKNWGKYKDFQAFNKKHFADGVGEEKFVKKIMADSSKVEKMKELIGENKTREIGISYVADLLAPLSKSGVARADSAITAIRKNSAPIKAALGDADYQALIDILSYQNRTNQSLSISRPSLLSMFDEAKGGIKGFAARIASSAKTYSDATGKPLSEPIAKAARPVRNTFESTLGKGMTRGNVSNIISQPIRPDIEMRRSGEKFIRTGKNEENENYRSPSQRTSR